LIVSKSAPTQFFVTISESTGTVRADESRLHMWRKSC
jgi:hypothetical protein